MHKPKTYYWRHHPIRVIQIDGQPWIVAADIRNALGYSPTYAVSRLLVKTPSTWKKKTTIKRLGAPGKQVWIINYYAVRQLLLLNDEQQLLFWFRTVTDLHRSTTQTRTSVLARLFNKVKVALGRATV